ncbi:hypothetical protein E1B28_009684 [Marasmius oreades]|uniref:Enhancer of polycomb-like protein n=1 Tax=Marasmius oreades TaxID=181124 RepID=A0A9P7RW96_9AGAR|nr:uncharacterized protein E1B28_009684 [Marasmius oreades]KAG7090577.1 hypothetical protein E1B28_009684 [Marasmius oreades]
MPRHGQAPSTNIRNRYRINNKSRLKVIRGNIDTDPVVVDEDEEKNRLLQSVAGVDQDDANEHHLQAVLSAAALQNGSTRGSGKEKETDKDKEESAPAVFIPVPDSTGLADNHEQFYPPNKYKDPSGYFQSTYTVEDLFDASLANGFSYVMDERDMEWLTKNNEEARGEGTSAQGAVSGTRVSSRSAKSKGKEPDSVQPVVITEDEFELVMGLYEKVTHEETEFLHHSLETGMTFPPFADYQDTFASPLPSVTFVSFTPPSWLPSPAHLTQIARAIYPYWKERKLERGGRRIIPTVNLDENDALNESYICFRRRDVKTARKTRASQVSSYDKLARLQVDFASVLHLANLVLQREQLKREAVAHSQHIWEERRELVEIRLKHPTVTEKGDEELLRDKERPSRRSEATRVKIPPKHESHTASRPLYISPKERYENYRSRLEQALQIAKEVDQPWEDITDTGYLQPPSAYASRLFKYVTPPDTPRSLSPDLGDGTGQNSGTSGVRQRRAVRLRYGRGGRRFIDRRPSFVDATTFTSQRKRPREYDDGEVDEERDRRLRDRWRFDSDDSPPSDPKAADEQDRKLVDEFDVKQLRYSLNLMHESDYAHVLNDPTLTLTTSDGQTRTVIPFRPSIPSALPIHQHNISRPAQNVVLAPAAQPNTTTSSSSRPGVFIPVSPAQGNHIETTIPRPGEISALTAPLREATFPDLQSKPIPASSSTILSQSQQLSQFSQPAANGVARPAINVPYVVKTEPVAPSSASSPSPQRSHQQSVSAQNQEGGGEQKPTVNGVAQPPLVNGHASNLDKSSSVNSNVLHLSTTTDMKLKLPPIRQTPKSSNSTGARGGIPIQRPPSSLGGNAKVI